MQSAGDKSQEPKGICSQQGDMGQQRNFSSFFCTVIEQLAWTDILKLLENQNATFLKSPGLTEIE